MMLAEAGEIFGYWEHNPPPHLMLQTIAYMLGWTPAKPLRPAASGVVPLAAAPPPGVVVMRGPALGMPSPLDAEALRERNRLRAMQSARRETG